MRSICSPPRTRREALRTALGAGALLSSACADGVSGGNPEANQRDAYERRQTAQTGALREIRLTVEEGEVDVGGQIYRTSLYNGEFPGPIVRVREGEAIRATVHNQGPDATTIHWHGIPVPNAMDGVPGLTQEPIPPGGEFVYEFVAGPAGSYMYHSHVGLQIDEGLIAPLIVEEADPGQSYDRDYNLVFDDFLARAPGVPNSSTHRGGRGMMRGMMGGDDRPRYDGFLVNGKLPADAPACDTRRGERVRLRFINPSGATTYRVAIAGHRMEVIRADGRPVEPVTVDALYLSMGERYDVLVDADNPGLWVIAAAPVEGGGRPAQATLRYLDVRNSNQPPTAFPEGLQGGRVLELSDLRALEPVGFAGAAQPDREIDAVLSGGMMRSAWTINGEVFPEAEPWLIHEGERVRVNMVNHSMILHPMHLHGHFFQAGGAVKDTVIVPAHMGRVSFDFLADNPGRWLFHCHQIYHLESGMAREIRYS